MKTIHDIKPLCAALPDAETPRTILVILCSMQMQFWLNHQKNPVAAFAAWQALELWAVAQPGKIYWN